MTEDQRIGLSLSSLMNVCVFAAQVASVESFINSVDSQMLQRQEQQKLAAISARVESYEAVEGGSEEVERVRQDFTVEDATANIQIHV